MEGRGRAGKNGKKRKDERERRRLTSSMLVHRTSMMRYLIRSQLEIVEGVHRGALWSTLGPMVPPSNGPDHCCRTIRISTRVDKSSSHPHSI